AAALRLIARLNGLGLDDPRLAEAACATGADGPVCPPRQARPRPGLRGNPPAPPPLPESPPAPVHPPRALATTGGFPAFAAPSGARRRKDLAALQTAAIPREHDALLCLVREHRNDLEQAAISLAPAIAEALTDLRALPQCELARMSGSGATCFGIFPSARAALVAARRLRAAHPRWWIRATTLR